MQVNMRISAAMFLALASEISARPSLSPRQEEVSFSAISVDLSLTLSLNTASFDELSLSMVRRSGAIWPDAVSGLQEKVTDACNDITNVLTANNPTFSATQCETLQRKFAESATMAAGVLTKTDELAKGDGFTGEQATTMMRVFTSQGTACDAAAAALEKACPSEKGNIMGAQAPIDQDLTQTEEDLDAIVTRKRNIAPAM